jgi:hypothetical protein
MRKDVWCILRANDLIVDDEEILFFAVVNLFTLAFETFWVNYWHVFQYKLVLCFEIVCLVLLMVIKFALADCVMGHCVQDSENHFNAKLLIHHLNFQDLIMDFV